MSICIERDFKPKLPPADYGSVELLVVAGSQAYGLATPESDYDFKGFYSAPIATTLGLRQPHDSWVSHDPADISMHETAHFVSLALKCNPNILEVIAIDDPHLIVRDSSLARSLRHNISCFFSRSAVQNAYGGYAASQFHLLENRGGTFSADTAKRTAKHARHLLRLLWQGEQILRTGELRVRVTPEEREALFAFGELPYDQMVAEAEEHLARFDAIESSILPDEPDFETINRIVINSRLTDVDVTYYPKGN